MVKKEGLLTDKFMAGIILGFVANIPKIILDVILYRINFSDFFCWHVTGGVLLSQKWLNQTQGLLIGAAMDFFFAGLTGVILIYFLYYFGEDRYLFIKGVLFNIGIWVFLCIITIDQRISMYAKLVDPGHAYHSFLVHGLWGVVASFLIVKYARKAIVEN